MFRKSFALAAVVFSLLCFFQGSSTASAQGFAPAEERHLEAYVGYYLTDVDLFEDAISFGGRGGYRWNRFGLEATVSRFETDVELTRETGDLEVLALDLSFNLYLNPQSRYEWSVFAGPGWEFFDSSSRFTRQNGEVVEFSSRDDTFSAHGGVALRIALGERTYLRPDLRVRWYDDGSALLDVEASVAFGYSFF